MMVTLCSDFALSDAEKHSPVQTGVALQVLRPKESLNTHSTSSMFQEIPSGGMEGWSGEGGGDFNLCHSSL